MQLTHLHTKLLAAALVALPLALTGCGDDVAGEATDGSTGGSTSSDSNSTNPSTTLTTTTDPGTTTDPTVADSSSGEPTTETTGPDTEGTTADADTTEGTSSGDEDSSSSSSTGTPAECGDGVLNGEEECDGDDVGDATCPVVGAVVCAADCTLDLSACTDTLVLCNTPAAALDATTTADAPLLDAVSVTDDLFVTDLNVTVDISHPWIDDLTGLIVAPDATNGAVLFDRPCGQDEDIDARFDDDGVPLTCNPVAPAVSGDVIPVTELRDLIGIGALGDWTLASWDNFSPADDGVLNEWCVEFTLSADDPVTCGDDVAHFGETCDGADLNGASCVSLGMGFVGGTLGCLDDCSYDTSMCVVAGCNGGVIDGDEVCDGADLGGTTCDDFDGLTGDGLACAMDCAAFDTTACTPVVCGDGMANGDEVCDGADLAGASCADVEGYSGMGLVCTDDCGGFDISACTVDFIEVCSTPAAAINNTLPPAVDSVNFTDVGTVGDVNVFVDITHTWVGDVTMNFASPTGTSILLFDGCGNVDNIDALFDDDAGEAPDCAGNPGVSGNTLPNAPLSTFDGEAIAGDWTLTVTDVAGGDNGTLNEWCVRILPE